MPSPFSNSKPVPQDQPGVIKVTDSVLVCDVCYEETDAGDYYEAKKLLVFTCRHGHHNEVKMVL